MIKDFEKLKKQLAELAAVINTFKSEAVQLRLVELIFHVFPLAEVEAAQVQPETVERKRRGAKRASRKLTDAKQAATPKPKKSKGGRAGPATVLGQLIDEKYFAQKRTLNDIISHCAKKAHNYKPNEISTPLARFVRDGRLKRDKNAESQYEYYQ